jgi:hypothetical protein
VEFRHAFLGLDDPRYVQSMVVEIVGVDVWVVVFYPDGAFFDVPHGF